MSQTVHFNLASLTMDQLEELGIAVDDAIEVLAKGKPDIAPYEVVEEEVKVFDLFTKQPYVPELGVEKILSEPDVDKNSVEMCERVLEDLKAGKMKGLVALTFNPKTHAYNYLVSITSPPDGTPNGASIASNTCFQWHGAIQMLGEEVMGSALTIGGYVPDLEELMGDME